MQIGKIGTKRVTPAYHRHWVVAMGGVLLCAFFWTTPAAAKKNDVRLDDSKISAEIEDAHLKDVLNKINEQKRFSVKGDPDLLDRKISVSFSDLSLRDGLKRILGPINYVLLFDDSQQPSGVILLDADGPGERRQSSEISGAYQLPEAGEAAPEDDPATEIDGRYENPDLLDKMETEDGSIEPPAEDDAPPLESPGELMEQADDSEAPERGETPPEEVVPPPPPPEE
jgi:hypothetical protein